MVRSPARTALVTLPLSVTEQAHAATLLIYAWTTVCVSHNRVANLSPVAAVRIKAGKVQNVRSTVPMVNLALSGLEISLTEAFAVV